ncbi:MAG: hypothetical protein ACFCU1_01670 [Sumerlaeia bacterium]
MNTKIAMGQNTNGNSITFRPAAGADVRITFAPTVASFGWGSHWIIGTASPNSSTNNIKTDNVIFDGNNGTDDHRLTIQNTDDTFAITILGYVADSDNAIVRNTVIKQRRTANVPLSGLRFASIEESASVFGTPDNFIVDNNIIENLSGGGAALIIDRNGGGFDTPGSNDGLITNNTFSATRFGIIATEHRNITIDKNLIQVNSSVFGGRPSFRITLEVGTSNTGSFPVTITNNIIQAAGGAASGQDSIGVFLGSTTASGGSYTCRVRNNSINSVKTTTTSPNQPNRVAGILVADIYSFFSISHNSISLEDSSVGSGIPLIVDGNGGIVIRNGINAQEVTATNNIVRSSVNGGYVVNIQEANPNLTMDNNLYFADSNTQLGRVAGVDITMLSALQSATGEDAASVVDDPLTGAEGRWNSLADLSLTGPAAFSVFGALPISGISTDIEGNTRGLVNVYKGAYELPTFANSNLQHWSLYAY